MRTARVLAIAVLAVGGGQSAAAQRAELMKQIQHKVLPNGLEIIVVENHGVPIVTIEAAVRNGSFTQGPAYEGLSHLYEHMIFKANRTYPRPEEFVGRASELGAVFNGTTREEVVNYYLTLSKDSVEGGVRFLAAALKYPLFRAEELDTERAVVIGEYDRRESDPFFPFSRALDRALWTTAYGRKDPLGQRDVILATTPEKMRLIKERYYVPNNTALILAGAITPEQAYKLVDANLGDWPRAPDPFVVDPIPPVPPLVRDTGVIVESPVGAVLVSFQWHGPSASKDPAATYAADVYSDVLNSPNSKFQQRLVDGGLFQGIGVNYYTLNQVGPITVQGQTTPDKLKQAIAALDAELKKTVEPGYITLEELEATKQKRIAESKFEMEEASDFAHTLGFWWAVLGLDYYYGYADAMARQTPADLARYANTYILGKPRVVGVMLAPEARRSLRLTLQDITARTIRP
jgi:zinc protease